MKNFRKMRLGNKGVSPVIATLLLIAIAVSASIIVYTWSTNLIGGLMVGGGQQVKEELSLEAYNWQNVGTLQLVFRNIGPTPITLASLYLNGILLMSPGTQSIPVQGTTMLVIAVSSGYVIGQSYTLKAVSATGAQFVFSVTCGQAG